MFLKKTFQRLIILLSVMLLVSPTNSYLLAYEELTPIKGNTDKLIASGHSQGHKSRGSKSHKGQRKPKSSRHQKKALHQPTRPHIRQPGSTPVRQYGGGPQVYPNYPPSLPQREPQTETYYPNEYFPNEMEESNAVPPESYYEMPEEPQPEEPQPQAEEPTPEEPTPEEEPPQIEVEQPPIEKSKKQQEVTPPKISEKKPPAKAAKFHDLPIKIRLEVYNTCYEKYIDEDEKDEFMQAINYNLFILCVVEIANRYLNQNPEIPSPPPAKKEEPLAPPGPT